MAKAGTRGSFRLVGVARRTRSALMVSTALQAVVVIVLAAPADAQPAPGARPMGGVVVGGSAAIAQTATNTTIRQSSQRAALNWQSFNVGSQQSVTFQQPNANAIALNTVTGPNPSQIAGRIDANGQVVLVNQSGVTFYKGSQVNTAGLMVSASATDPKAFMSGGKIAFDQAGNPNARIINDGNITISGAGLASLVAPSVANAGEINAKLGHVVLAGAKTATLDLYGDKLVTVNVTGAVTQAPDGGEALVTNTGVIRADGGSVRLTARAVDGVVTNLVTAGGNIQARTTGGHQGDIAIEGVGGSITITGNLEATGKAAGTTGGRIGLLATDAVIVKPGAVVNASGATGGGTIAIGTTLKRAEGGAAVTGARTAKAVVIQPGAVIAANAAVNGNGGRVTVLSSRVTAMQGSIAAKGGPAGGDGGFVEVSGEGGYSLTGLVDVSAPLGKLGNILLDPTNLTIIAGTTGSGDQDVNVTPTGTILFSGADTTNDQVSNGALQSLTGNILLQAVNNLTVSAPITLTLAGQSLTLQAGNNLVVQTGAPITTKGDITLSAAEQSINGFTAAGALTLNDAVSTSSGAVQLSAGTGGLTLNANLAATTVDLISTGTIAQTAGSISAVSLTGSAAASVSLTQVTNSIGNLGAFTATTGSITLVDGESLNVTSAVSALAGDIVLRSAGAGNSVTILDNGALFAVSTGTVSVRADAFSNTGVVIGGVFEYAQDTSGALKVGTGGAIVDLTGIETNMIRLGSVRSAATPIATSITLTSDLDLGVGHDGGARALDLRSNGDIDGGGNKLLNVTTLTGVANSGSVTLGNLGNVVDSIGTFTAGAGFTLGSAADLSVTGVLTAGGPVALSANSISIPGSITTGGSTSGSVSLIASGTTIGIGGTGAITTGTLTGSALTTIDLPGANQISTLGSFTGLALNLNDGAALTINNTVSASGGVSLTSSGLLSVASGQTVSGADVTLSGTGLAIAGQVTSAGTVDLIATSGSIGATGTIDAGTLTGASGTSATLTGTNLIDNLGAFTATAGTIALTDGESFNVNGGVTAAAGDVVLRSIGIGNDIAIQGEGTLAAPAGTVSVRADAFSITSPGTITGVLFEYAQDTPGVLTVGTGGTFASLAGIGTGAIRLGSAEGTITANGLTLTSNFNAGNGGTPRALDLRSTVGISDGGFELLNVSTLTGVANTGSVSLGNVLNTVTTIGAFTVGAGFTLADSVDLTVAGVLSAAPVSLTAPNITISGSITTGGSATSSVTLVANPGTIGGTGSIATGTLTGSAELSADLPGNNQIGTLGPFIANGLTVNSVNGLTVAGLVNGQTNGLAITSSGSLIVAGTATAAAISLTGAGIAIDGLVSDGGAGSVALNGNGGSITEPGTLIAGTLSGTAAAISLLGATTTTNQVAGIATLSATGALALDDGQALTVNGALGGGTSVTVLNTGLFINNGTISGAAISLTADTLTLGGVVTAGTIGTVNLVANIGTIDQTGTLTAGVLSGGAGGSITLSGASAIANQIGTVGPLNGVGILLNDGTALAVANTVNGGAGTVTIDSSGLLSVAGTVTAAAVGLTGTAISIAGLVTAGGAGPVDLAATSGGIAGSGTVSAATLTGTSAASVNLSGTNTIAALGPFSVTTGSFALNNGSPMTVSGSVNGPAGVTIADAGSLTVTSTISSSGGNVRLGAGGPGGVLINAGSVIASGDTVSVSADTLTITGGTIVAATMEFGPAVNGGTVTLGGGAFGLSDIGATKIRVGSVNGSVVAGAIVIAGYDNGGHPLELDASGTVTETGALTSVSNLTGTAASYELTTFGNTIGTLGGGIMAGGSLVAAGTAGVPGTLAVWNDQALALSGLVSAGTVDLSTAAGTNLTQAAGATLVAGVLTSTHEITGAAILQGTTNQVGTIANLTALGGLTFVDSAALTLAGQVSPGAAGTLDISTSNGAGITQAAAATLLAGVLTSASGVAGDIVLHGTGNILGTIAALTAAGISVVDNVPLTLAGRVSVGSSGTVDISTNSGAGVTQGAAGTLIAGVLTSASGIAGDAILRGTANQIGTISGLTAGGLTVVDNQVLTLAGAVSVGVAGTVDLSTTAGAFNVTQAASGTLTAGVLTSASGVSGDIILQGTLNQIGTIRGLTAGGLTVVDDRSLTLAGAVSAGTVDISTMAGGFDVTQGASGTLTAGVLTSGGGISGNLILQGALNQIGTISGLTAAGLTVVDNHALTLAGAVSAGTAGTVDISTSGGASVTQGAAGTLIAGVLTSASGVSGNEILQGTANRIGTISGLTAAGLTIVDSKALTLAGLVSAGTVDITTSGGANLSQAAGGTLVASVLTSSGNIAGTAILQNTANAIGTLSGFTATGSLEVVNGTEMTIAGTVGASAGNVYLTTGISTLNFAPGGGTVASVAGGIVGIQADDLANLGFPGATGAVNAGATGTFELAPSTTLATVTLGSAAGLSLTSLTGITAGTVRIGEVTLPGGISPTVIAGSIAVAGTFNAASIGTLDLEANGTISQLAGAPIINLATLLASTNGTAGDITLGSTLNSIAVLGDIGVTAGNFSFGDTPGSGSFQVSSGQTVFANNVSMTVVGTLVVNGAVTASGTPGDVALTAQGPAADLIVGTGTITANGTASLTAGRAISQTGGFINAGSVSETAGGPLSIAGTVSAAAVSLAGASIAIPGEVTDGGSGTVNLVATSGTIDETGTLIAGTLSGDSTLAATTLTGANHIAALGSFTAVGFALNDGSGLTVNGPVNGGPSATIADAASLNIAGTVNAGAISLTATSIAIPGEVTDGGSGTVSLIATGGTIAETGTLIAGTLSGGSTPGATTLTGANHVAALGSFTAVGFTLNDGESLTVNGVLGGGPAVTIADTASLTVAGTVSAGAIDLTAASIAIPGEVTDGGAGTVNLVATTGTIDETGTLIAGTLSGGSTPGATTLTGATPATNQVATLGTFTAAGFTLNDGESLSVNGVLNGGTAATITDTAVLTIAGTVSAGAINLTAASVGIPGLVTDGGSGTVALIATAGTINETGTLIAGTLSGASTLAATTLTGATPTTNQVATVGTFTAAGFTLNDGESLSVNGLLNGGTAATIADAASLTVAGTMSAGAINLTAASIAIPGEVTDGGAGMVNLVATAGTINETGTLIAGTLSGGSTLAATTLSGATVSTNQIATLGAFTAAGFTLNDGESLTVSGVISGGTVAAITDTAALTVAGTVQAGTIDLTAASIAIPGEVTDGGAGSVSLMATGGTISEIGTLIAGTLSGGSTLAATTLTGANQVAAIGSFTAAGFTLDDDKALTVNGVLSGGSGATIADTASLTVAGKVNAAAIDLTAASITIPGVVTDGGAGTVNLIATTGTIGETGTLIAGTLSGGSALAATTMTGASPSANQVATLGSFTAVGFTLNDGRSLTVNAVVIGGPGATIADTASLTVAGTVNASAINLTAASVAIPGEVTDGGAGSVSLIATSGTINETGTLIAGTLSGGSTLAATTLTGAGPSANQVATIGSFAALGFTMNDGESLTVNGRLSGGPDAAITGTALLTVAGTVSAGAINLTAASIAIPGLVTDGGSGTVNLIATAGTINETGTLIAGTLSGGSALAATTLIGATPAMNQVAAIGSFTAVGFTMNDGESLSVNGVLSGGPAVTIADAASLTAAGTVNASAIDLTAASIAIPGEVTDGGAGTVNLVAATGTIDETGTLIAGTLSGGSTGSTTMTGATPATNQVATVGTFTAAGFTLNDGENLSVNGVLNGGTAATITDTDALTVAGTLNAAAINLTAASIGIPGLVTDGGAGTVSLVATAGTINETGTLIAGTLSGGSTLAATTLTGATPTTNQVAAIGSFTAAGFTMNDGESLSVNGVLSGGPGVTIADIASLTVAGDVNAGAINLTAAAIALPGLVTDGGSGTVNLLATSGTINETGTLIAGTLSGGSTGSTTMTGATPTTNQVATIASFNALGFTMNDGESLTVNGSVSGGPNATITDAAALTVAGNVSAAAINLTAANIAIPGVVTDGGSGTVSLIATAGTIDETGTLIAGTLSGGSTGQTVLTGATAQSNQVATVANFTASGFTLDAGGNLTVAGSVNGGPAAYLNSYQGVLSVFGTVTAAAVTLAGGGEITIPGEVTDGGSGTVNLISPLIAETGTLIAGTLFGVTSPAETTLIGANQVGTLGLFAALDFTLNDNKSLLVNGPVTALGGLTINDTASLTVAGTLGGPTINLTAASIALPGVVTNSAFPGVVTNSGAGTVSLVATAGTIAETGTLTAGTLSGQSSGPATLTGATPATNQIAAVGTFTAAGFTLNDGTNLTVAGTLNGGTVASIVDSALLSVAGTISAAAVSLTASSIAIGGAVTDGGSGTVSLIAGGTIDETGTLIAGTLSGNAAGPATLTGASPTTNQVAAITNFTAASFILNDGRSLSVSGPIAAGGSFALTDTGNLTIGPAGSIAAATVGVVDNGDATVAGSITSGGTAAFNVSGALTIPGTIRGQNGVTLSANGDMSLAGLVTSPSGGIALTDAGLLSLTNTASIAASTSIAITDTNTMILAGLLSAPRIVVDNGAGRATILDGTRIQTSGQTRPPGPLTVARLPTSATSALGFFMTTGQLTQNGALTVSGSPSIVRIDASTGITLAGSSGGIVAPNTWLVLGFSTGAKAAGGIDVLYLDTVFTGQSTGTSLSGTVGGLNGYASAGAAHIEPETNAAFRINGCPIASINCVMLTTQNIPTASPLNNFVFGSIFDPNDEDDLLLPLVSDEVY